MVRGVSNGVILFDGWPLAYEPNGPAALHLYTLLDSLAEEFQAVVALPAKPVDLLPGRIVVRLVETPPTQRARLGWEQITIDKLAKNTGARVIQLASGWPAIFGRAPSLVSPTASEPGGLFLDAEPRPPVRYDNLAARLRAALEQGGMRRASGILWPADLPKPDVSAPLFMLPPAVPDVFFAGAALVESPELERLPDTYILYHGPTTDSDLRRLLDAWSWATPALGVDFPLLLLGMDEPGRRRLAELEPAYRFEPAVQALPALPLALLAEVYRRSSALFHPASIAPWGNSLRLAMVCGKSIVALENPLSDALVRSAAYLAPPGVSPRDTCRALGAALVTVIVEEDVAASLAEESKKRSDAWKASGALFRDGLSAVYRQIFER